jgi:nucleotide-binding universal stress UspA family protein
MSTKIIISYDGTANEDDAIALGRVFAGGGAEVALAYVRHSQEPDLDREKLAQGEAEELLARGAALFGNADIARHVVTDRSTPQGLSALAESEGASVVVFCSDSHTAHGHISVGNSAEQLLEGGPVAVAIAPVGLADGLADGPAVNVQSIVAIGDADGGARATAESLAGALGATVAPVANDDAGLLVVDSRPEAEQGRVAISASAEHLVEIATCSVLVLPRGVVVPLGQRTAVSA